MNNNGVVLNHLFFMDDLKLYGRSDVELKTLLDIVDKFSHDIDMKFGFDKCASLKIEAGKRKVSSGILLPSGDKIRDLDEEGYKYLGVLQEADIKCTEMKEIVKTEYLRRVKGVARSRLYAKNIIIN